MSAPAARRAPSLGLLVAGLVGVAFNLRTLVASLPPLVPAIRDELGLDSVWIGVLTTLPVLCMGLFAPPAARFGHRLGSARVVGIAMVLVVVGNLARAFGDRTWPLFVGTLAGGVGLALAGTLMPGLVKSLFPPQRAGLATGLTMFAMMGGAAVSSAVSVPLAQWLGSWEHSLGVWGVVAVVGLAVWLPVQRAVTRHEVDDDRPVDVSHRLPWRSATALIVAAYLFSQSWQFYSSLAWLSPTYADLGWNPADAGYLLSLFTGAQLVSGLVAPALTDRVRDWRVLLVAAALCGLAGELGIWLVPEAAPWVWALLLGAGQGAAFALGLVLLVRYAVDPAASARFTAMAFLVSYTVASAGPTVMGAVHDAAGSFQVIWGGLALLMVPQLLTAVLLRPDRAKVS